MLDMHNHIIYGVDDGAETLEESVQMGKMYADQGYDTIITSSHYKEGRYLASRDKQLEKIPLINDALKEEGIDLEILPGNELYYHPSIIENLEKGVVSSLGDSKYVLIEFSPFEEPVGLDYFIYNLQMAGYIAIFAHVERYDYIQKDPEWVLPYIDKGTYMQCNFSYLTKEGSKGYNTILGLLERGYVHLFATDAHQVEWRSPDVREEHEILKGLIGDQAYEELVVENPYRILKNKRLLAEPVEIQGKKKKGSWSLRNWFKRRK